MEYIFCKKIKVLLLTSLVDVYDILISEDKIPDRVSILRYLKTFGRFQIP